MYNVFLLSPTKQGLYLAILNIPQMSIKYESIIVVPANNANEPTKAAASRCRRITKKCSSFVAKCLLIITFKDRASSSGRTISSMYVTTCTVPAENRQPSSRTKHLFFYKNDNL